MQGNPQGMNPYGYVGGNPETLSDPSGQYIPRGDGSGGPGPGNGNQNGYGPPPVQIPSQAPPDDPWNPLTWPKLLIPEGASVPEEVAIDAGAAICFVCVAAGSAVLTLGQMLVNPTPLASGDKVFDPKQPDLNPHLNRCADCRPQTQTGGDGGKGKPPIKPPAPGATPDPGRKPIEPDFQKGAAQMQADYNLGSNYYGGMVDPGGWTFQGIDGMDNINADSELESAGFTERYYFRFKTSEGYVRVSGDYNPDTGGWNDSVRNGFHLSSSQRNPFWQQEADNQFNGP